MFHPDLAKEFWNSGIAGPCPYFTEGQEFIADWFEPPEGFLCTWAWHDIYKQFMNVMYDLESDAWKDSTTRTACCTDAIRPVVFKLERINIE